MTSLIITLILLGSFAVIAFCMQATKQKRRGRATPKCPPVTTDELVNRINEWHHKRLAAGDCSHRTRVYSKPIPHPRGHTVPVMVTDGRDAWLHKMGIYDEQVDLMITEIKTLLHPQHGMS